MLLAGLTMLAPLASAKDKKPKAAPPKDENRGGWTHSRDQRTSEGSSWPPSNYSSYYLYAERGPGQAATLIDVTKISQPSVLADVAYAPNNGSGN